MVLEYFAEATPPVLLLHGLSPDETRRLRGEILELADQQRDEVRIESQSGPTDAERSLLLRAGDGDLGVVPRGSPDLAFCCVLRPDSWRHVCGLLEPFEDEQTGHRHQYLTDSTAVDWIVSSTRSW